MSKLNLKTVFAGLIALSMMTSCEKSVKGKWIEKDKKEFTTACLGVVKSTIEKDEILKEMKVSDADIATICSCELQKMEAGFDAETIKKSGAELSKIFEECRDNTLLGEKGKWKAPFRDYTKRNLAAELSSDNTIPVKVVAVLSECIVGKLENGFSPQQMSSKEIMEKITTDCIGEMDKK